MRRTYLMMESSPDDGKLENSRDPSLNPAAVKQSGPY
jgi:hypothetical protein